MRTRKAVEGRRRGTRRTSLGVLFLLLAAPAAYADGEFSDADSPSEVTATAAGLGLSPATGGLDVPVTVTIPAACPTGADSVILQVSGGGFPANSNVLGVTDITADPSVKSWAPGTWEQIAANNQTSATALTGTADLKLICLNGPSPQDYTATVTFGGTPKTYTAGGAGSATPTPTPASTPTPTPAGGTPTPTPAVATPTPTPGSDATPTPTPTVSTSDGTGHGGATTDGDPDLPDTGSHARPMLWLAAFLLCSGLGLLILPMEPPVEDPRRPRA
jgi:hypothetical protein